MMACWMPGRPAFVHRLWQHWAQAGTETLAKVTTRRVIADAGNGIPCSGAGEPRSCDSPVRESIWVVERTSPFGTVGE